MEISPLFSGDSHGISISQQPGYQKTVSEWCERVYDESKHELENNEEIINLDKSISFLLGKQ